MAWRDRLQTGSFRGVQFKTRTNEVQAGRRKAIYELPFDSSGVASIDLGRRARRYTIDAIIIGEDFDLQVNKFIEALEAEGPGLLVHPTLGISTMVEIELGSIHTDSKAGGMAEIRFEAVESRAKAPSPASTPDQKGKVGSSVDKLNQVNLDAWLASYRVDNQPEFVQESALSTIETAINSLSDLNSAISAVLSVPGQIATDIDNLSKQVATLLDTPKALYDAIAGAILKVFGAVDRVAGRLGVDVSANPRPYDTSVADEPLTADPLSLAMRSTRIASKSINLTAGAKPAGTRDTPARAQERANSAAISNATSISALSALVEAANELEITNRQDATTIRDILVQQFDAVIDSTAAGDDTDEAAVYRAAVYDALENAKAAVRQRFSGKGLTEVTTYTPLETIPADLIAWNVYGDADRADEIVARNGIAHPGAVPAHMALEVTRE